MAALFNAASDEQWLVVLEVLLAARLQWHCPCDWYNPRAAAQCEQRGGPRPSPAAEATTGEQAGPARNARLQPKTPTTGKAGGTPAITPREGAA